MEAGIRLGILIWHSKYFSNSPGFFHRHESRWILESCGDWSWWALQICPFSRKWAGPKMMPGFHRNLQLWIYSLSIRMSCMNFRRKLSSNILGFNYKQVHRIYLDVAYSTILEVNICQGTSRCGVPHSHCHLWCSCDRADWLRSVPQIVHGCMWQGFSCRVWDGWLIHACSCW